MGNGFNTTEDMNPLSFLLDQGSVELPDSNLMESTLSEIEEHPSVSIKNQSEPTTNPFLPSFLTELIPCIKNQLAAIRSLTSPPADRFEDGEFRKTFQRSVIERIRQIDSVLNSLLNYININTPVIKTNTLHFILEEVLEANEKQLQEKNIKIYKSSEKDLPETYIHDEQVKFIFNSVLQYAILSIPLNGSIGFLFRASSSPNGEPNKKTSLENNGESIEAIIGFTGNPESTRALEPPSSPPLRQREGVIDLILPLVAEILEKNHGMMKWELDERKSRVLVSLRFPIERRKVVYYERINI
ncbi:MAG: hypothetical protein A2156_07165 [Deltaproteobacteria bacterium RBG_16_48_10]|nr:MAG: hypothetical protein A2156_07165 [Deltaproteobacteria bacterium RBG_16_48_10]